MQAKNEFDGSYVNVVYYSPSQDMSLILNSINTYTQKHRDVLELIKKVKKDRNLTKHVKINFFQDFSQQMVEHQQYDLLASTFRSIPDNLKNENINLRLSYVYRNLLAADEYDALYCASAILNNDYSCLPHNLFNAINSILIIRDWGKSDAANIGMAQNILLVALKLGKIENTRDIFINLTSMALDILERVRNKSLPIYLQTHAQLCKMSGRYHEALRAYEEYLQYDYDGQDDVRANMQEIHQILYAEEQARQQEALKAQMQEQVMTSQQIAYAYVNYQGAMFSNAANTAQPQVFSVDHVDIYNMLYQASMLELDGRYVEALSMYQYVLILKHSTETEISIARCNTALERQSSEITAQGAPNASETSYQI